MQNEQISALTELLNFCRRALRSNQVNAGEWQKLRSAVNRALIKPGRPIKKTDYGMIWDLKAGVPVTVVAKKYKMSRGTVYRMIENHPELAKLWEGKKKKKQPDPMPISVPNPTPVLPTQPPLPDVLVQFLAAHRPKVASSPLSTAAFKRQVLRVLLSQLGLAQPAESDTMTDDELVARVTAYQGQGENQSDVIHPDAAESPPSPSPAVPDEAATSGPKIQVRIRDVDDWLSSADAARVIAEEITQNLEPFADLDADHPLFTELKPQVKIVISMMMLKGQEAISGSDIPEIARRAVRRIKNTATIPKEVLVFAGIVST